MLEERRLVASHHLCPALNPARNDRLGRLRLGLGVHLVQLTEEVDGLVAGQQLSAT